MSMSSSTGAVHEETMTAWRFIPGNTQATQEKMPIPHPKPNEVLVKLLAGGVCHTDVGILDPSHNLSRISPNNYTLGSFH